MRLGPLAKIKVNWHPIGVKPEVSVTEFKCRELPDSTQTHYKNNK